MKTKRSKTKAMQIPKFGTKKLVSYLQQIPASSLTEDEKEDYYTYLYEAKRAAGIQTNT